MSTRRQAWSRVLRSAWPVGLVLLLGLPSLLYPFGFDQSNHAFIAWRVLAGERLYTDVFSLKPPLTTLVHALSQLAFGHHMAAVRLWDLAWLCGEALLLAQLIKRAFPGAPRAQAPLAVFFYALSYYAITYWDIAQTDGWASLPITASLLLAFERRESTRAAGQLAAGACAMLAGIFKYTLAPALALPALVVLSAPADAPRTRVSKLVPIAAGALLALLVGVLLLWSTGALSGFVEVHLPTVFHYGARVGSAATGPAPGVVDRLVGGLARVRSLASVLHGAPTSFTLLALLSLAAPLLALRARRPETSRGVLILLAWWLCAALSTLVQGRFFVYHYLPLLAPSASLAAFSIAELARLLRAPWARRALPVGIALLLFGASLDGARPRFTASSREYARLTAELAGGFDLAQHYGAPGFVRAASFHIADDLAMAAHIKPMAREGDRMFVWGTTTALSFLTRLPPVTSVYTSIQVTESFGSELSREAWLAQFRAAMPRFFVVQQGDAIPHVLPNFRGSDRELTEFVPLLDVLRAHYRPAGRVRSLSLFMRRDADTERSDG